MVVKSIQKSHIHDTLYLQYYLRKSKLSLEDYNIFCSKLSETSTAEYVDDVCEKMAVDLLPYIFTVQNMTKKDFTSFIIFYWQYATYANINTSIVQKYLNGKKVRTGNIRDIFLEIIQQDVTSFVSFLIIMQYYFL